MDSVAIWLATSPAAAPPIPSATTSRVPRSPSSCSRTAGWSDATLRVRSATRKQSSLCSRVLPTSDLAKTRTLTGFEERPNILGPPYDRTARGEVRIYLEALVRPLHGGRVVAAPFVRQRHRTRGVRAVAVARDGGVKDQGTGVEHCLRCHVRQPISQRLQGGSVKRTSP